MKSAAMENENIGGQRDKKKSNNVNRRKFYFATIFCLNKKLYFPICLGMRRLHTLTSWILMKTASESKASKANISS